MTREQKIKAGKIWQVYTEENDDNILFEGTKIKCWSFIRNNCPAAYKKGTVKLGKLIYENLKN